MGGGEDTVPAMLRPGEGVLVPEATQMLGGEQGINAINRTAERHHGRKREKNFDTPTYEDTLQWTEADWKEWRRRHPNREPTPSPTPRQHFKGGGVAGGGKGGIDMPWAEPTPIPVGFYGGTDNNPQFWTNTQTGEFGNVQGYYGGGIPRGGPWGSFNPMNNSWTQQSFYGRHWLDKMFQGSGNASAQSLARGGVVRPPAVSMDDVIKSLRRLGIKI